MWCSFYPSQSRTTGASLCMPYCNDVVAVLCQLRHIRTYCLVIVQSWRVLLDYNVHRWAGVIESDETVASLSSQYSASTSNSRHTANH